MYINVPGKDVAAAREFYTKWAWFIHSFGEQKACVLDKSSRTLFLGHGHFPFAFFPTFLNDTLNNAKGDWGTDPHAQGFRLMV